MIEVIGYTAAIFTVFTSLPQLVKTIRTKSAGDVSVLMFVFMIIGTTLWATYGLMTESTAIVVSNALAAIIVATNLYYKIKFG